MILFTSGKGIPKMRNDPPVILVKTWVHLIQSSESKEVKERANVMLLNAFIDLKSAIEFCRLHDINLK
jgi:hypothetical protein